MTPQDFEVWLKDERWRPLVMGVLNVTPDSFSESGRYADPEAAIAHGLSMLKAGADLLDVGGESTRPGSQRTPAEEQIARVVPVIEALSGQLGNQCLMSIDTTRAAVAGAALDAGAAIINDISAATDDAEMLPLAASRNVPIILMHKQGEPATMQVNPSYGNVVEEVAEHLRERAEAARSAGVADHRILVDPGIGFGKALEHNLALLGNLPRFAALGHPMVVGTSRKGFLARITGETEPRDRLFSTAASVAWCVANRAAIVRVHDVEPMVKVVRVIDAIQGGSGKR
jgi:dihydropteroate synthase